MGELSLRIQQAPNKLVFFASIVLLCACHTRQAADYPVADILIINGQIYTQNPEQPRASAVAIADKKFIFVGDNSMAENYRGKATRVLDLQYKMAMPGLVDAHVHPVLAGMEKIYDCNFPHSSSLSQIAEKIKNCIAARPSADWIIGGRWGKAVENFSSTISEPT